MPKWARLAKTDAKPMTMHHAIGSWINCSLKSAESCKTPFPIRQPLHHGRCHAASRLLSFSVYHVDVFKSRGLHVRNNSGPSLRKRTAPQQIVISTCNLGRAGFCAASIAYDHKSSQDGAFMGPSRTHGSRGQGHRDAYVSGIASGEEECYMPHSRCVCNSDVDERSRTDMFVCWSRR